MICYRDRTFCTHYETCRNGTDCSRALTPSVQQEAEAWWGKPHPPIAIYAETPDCYKAAALQKPL